MDMIQSSSFVRNLDKERPSPLFRKEIIKQQSFVKYPFSAFQSLSLEEWSLYCLPPESQLSPAERTNVYLDIYVPSPLFELIPFTIPVNK